MPRPKGSKNGHYTLVKLTCFRCGKRFSRKPSDARAKYCSRACYFPPRPAVECQGCGKSYVPECSTRGKFCSMLCVRNRVTKNCPQCKRDFSVMASKAHKFNFCSFTCRKNASPVITCRHCGKEFKTFAVRAEISQFCSRKCHWDSKRTTYKCAYCGKERTVKSSKMKHNRQCCSNRCNTLLRMENGFLPGYIANKLRTGYRTDIEALAEEALKTLKVPYLFEHKCGRYLIDFALPMLGIALECDGWQHLTVRGRARDILRDAKLSAEGWRVIHVMDRDIRADALSAVRGILPVYE